MRTRTFGTCALLAVLWCVLSSSAALASTTSRAEHVPGILPALATTVPVSATATVTSTDVVRLTPFPTASASSTMGPTDTPTGLTPSATSTITTTETLTLTPMPTSTGTATARPSPSPTPSSSPTAVSISTRTPIPAAVPAMSPMPTRVIAILVERAPMILGGCLVLFLLVVGVALITWVLRRKKPPVPEAPPPGVPVVPYLESVGATGRTRRYDLTPGGVTIGRAADNDLVITQDFLGWETVSRRHARVRGQAGRWIVEDLDSMNGVYVNGRRTGRNLLREGWRLAIGGVEFVFRAGGGEA
jgi:hypothetical protein